MHPEADQRPSPAGSRTGTAALLVAGLSVACCLAVFPVRIWTQHRGGSSSLFIGDFVLATAWPVAGALVVRAVPRNAVGWVLLGSGLMGPYLLSGVYAAGAVPVRTPNGTVAGGSPGGDAAAWVATWGFVPYFFVLPLVLLLFPDGRPASPRWRPVVIAVIAVAAVATAARMVAPVMTDLAPAVVNPWAIDREWLKYVTYAGATLCLFAGSGLGVASLVIRARRSRGVPRIQVQWLMLGGAVLLIGSVPGMAGTSIAFDALFAIGLLGPPVAIAVATLRHGLFDVVFALNRTIVFVVLSALVVGAYAAAVLALGSIGATSGPGLLLVGVAALAAAAGRSVVQRAVDRALFGHRRDPYAVVSRVGRHIAPAAEPAEALHLLVEALRDALRLPYVAFVDPDGVVMVSAGAPTAGWHSAPAHALGRQVGELHAGLRRPGEAFGAEERDAITEVAARAATLAYAAQLVTDVAESRSRIVLAREEERRRLRADLHDGLGPTLAGTAHQLDALATRLDHGADPDAAARARDLRDRLRSTVGDVRSIVHGLRPPVLDQMGLAAALRSLLDGYEIPHCTAEVAPLDGLPAAMEVAAYTIAAEAVANAIRHSAAGQLRLRAAMEGEVFVVEVIDNGCGVQPRRRNGVGLRSMGERAAEVGGRLELRTPAGGGTGGSG